MQSGVSRRIGAGCCTNTKPAILLLALLCLAVSARCPVSAQGLSDVEISAGYCLGMFETYVRDFKNFESSLPSDIGQDARQEVLAANKRNRADRERLLSYLMAKGLFSPSRALDFRLLLASINRGKADAQHIATYLR